MAAAVVWVLIPAVVVVEGVTAAVVGVAEETRKIPRLLRPTRLVVMKAVAGLEEARHGVRRGKRE